MGRPPLTFNTIVCLNPHCGAIVALMPPGAIVYDTEMRCVHCGRVRKVVPVTTTTDRQKVLTTVPA